MSLILEKPDRGFVTLRDAMSRMFDSSFLLDASMLPWRFDGQVIPVDVYEEKDKLVVKASVPTMKPEEINVEVEGNLLTISGESKVESEKKEATYYRRERRYGRFERMVALPYEVAADKVEALCKDGILTVTMPKTSKKQGKETKIKVKT